MKKIVISWIVCVLGLVILFSWVGTDIMTKNGKQAEEAPLITGKFTLQNGSGKLVTEKDMHGKYMLIYFGFTHCPDICPTTLLLMNNALQQLGPKAEKVQPIFITLDPERDTPKKTETYASHFSPKLMGLSGTPEQIKQVADNFKIYYSKVEQKNSALGYVIDHSAFIYLMDPKGNYINHFAGNVSEQELTEGLAKDVR